MTYKYNTTPLAFFVLCMAFSIFTSGKAKAQNDLKVTLDTIKEENIQHLGYDYSLPAWMLSRPISTIESDDFDHSIYTSFGNRLEGHLPGLTVLQSNNEPGLDSPTLYSRGVGTFGAKKNPLIIVDGFESFYEQLVPEEIESVTLLKDAAAATMYGMRGANGVLLITTKRGKKGPLKVEFTMQTGFDKPYRLPDFLGSYDYARLHNEARGNDGLSPLYTEDDLQLYQSGNDPYFHPNVNWNNELLRSSAPVSKFNLTFSGGQNNVRYFVLLGIIRREGLYKETDKMSEFSINSEFTRYNVRSNVDLDITDKLTANLNLGFTVADKQNPGDYSTNSIFNLMSTVPPNAFPVHNPNGTYGGNALYTNPWGNLVESGYFTTNYRTSQTSLKLTQQLDMLTDGLSVSAAISFNNYFRGYSSKSRSYQRYSISKDSQENILYQKFGEKTSLKASEDMYDHWRNITFQSYLTYKKTFEDHQFDAALGYDLNTYTNKGEANDFKHLGGNGRLSYVYQKKYIGELSFGYYGSNGYQKNKRFGLFPGMSLGWIVSNENFWKENSAINYFQLRTSYGISGSNAIDSKRFMYDQYFSGEGSYIYGTSSIDGLAESQIANPNLTWEKKKEWNIGFEAQLFRNLSLKFDYFNQLRYDILTQPQNLMPQFAGVLLPQWNVGEVKNKGFEAQIGYKNQISKNFSFFADLSVWYAKNEITRIPEILKQDEYQQLEGRLINQPFLLEAVGFFQNDAEIEDSPVQIFDVVRPGDIKYKDQNSDGIIDQRDFYPIGYTDVPEFNTGLNAGIEFKNIYLDLFFHGVTNRSVYLSGKKFHAFQNDGKISSIALGRWTETNGESATYPRLSSQNNMNNFQPSSFWQRDGSFIRLRNAELGYILPKSLTEKIGIPEAKIFINGTNIFTIDRVDVADPEILTGYPATKTFSIGAKIQL